MGGGQAIRAQKWKMKARGERGGKGLVRKVRWQTGESFECPQSDLGAGIAARNPETKTGRERI